MNEFALVSRPIQPLTLCAAEETLGNLLASTKCPLFDVTQILWQIHGAKPNGKVQPNPIDETFQHCSQETRSLRKLKQVIIIRHGRRPPEIR
jgi:hypothetical protein